MKKKTKILLIVLDVILVAGIIAGVLFYRNSRSREVPVSEEDLARRYTRTVTLGEEEVPLRRHVTSILLIGTDNYIDDEKQNEIELHYNFDLADFLVLLVFDHESKTVTPFQINRDTMCEVPWISVNGITDGTEFEQICFAHTYGSGKEDSCKNTVTAVSDLLCGVPVENYFAFTMDAVPILNDAVGGVTVELSEDLPSLGEEYVKGAVITLKGDEAIRFVRIREYDPLDANLPRMARHRQYIEAFTESARSAVSNDSDFAVNTFNKIKPYLVTDLSMEQLTDMVNYLNGYELLPAVTCEGEYVEGEFAEFYPDEASLRNCIREIFCERSGQ